jgi:hypothetical protein
MNTFMAKRFLTNLSLVLLTAILTMSCSTEETASEISAAAAIASPTPTPVVTNQNGLTTIVVNLAPTEGEGQTGTATFVSDGSTTTVEIEVKPPAAEAQPIHVHTGVCTDVGTVRHALQNIVKGMSVTIIDQSIAEITEGGALVNVHASYTESSNYTACGQLPDSLTN